MSHCECHDTEKEHDAWQAKEMAYWASYFGQDYGTKEERRRRLMAMDMRPETLNRAKGDYDVGSWSQEKSHADG